MVGRMVRLFQLSLGLAPHICIKSENTEKVNFLYDNFDIFLYNVLEEIIV